MYAEAYKTASLQNYVILTEETKNDFCPRTYLIASNASDLLTEPKSIINFTCKSEEDVEFVLNTIQWNLFVFSCDDISENSVSFPRIDSEFFHCCSNHSGHFTNKFSQVFKSTKPPDCLNSDCNEKETTVFYKQWMPVLVLGVVCIFGNLVVIIQKIVVLFQSSSNDTGQQIYFALVLSLALSDLLIGIYLTAMSFEFKHKIAEEIYFSEPGFCNALGIIHFVASQVSVTTLATISCFRYFSVVYPYKQQNFKLALKTIIATWFLWSILGIIPILEFEPFASIFTSQIRGESTFTSNNVVSTFETNALLNSLLKLSLEHSNLRYILNAATKFNTRAILRKSLDTFGLIDLTDTWSYTGYYSSQYGCSISYTADQVETQMLDYFTFGIVSFNFFCCFAMIIAYSNLAFSVSGKQLKSTFPLFQCCWRNKLDSRSSTHSSDSGLRVNENQTLFCRIAVIVFTDMMCWISLCIIFLYYWFSEDVHQQYAVVYGKIQTTLIWKISLNCILNPYIYSIPLWKSLFSKFKKMISRSKETTVQHSV